MRAIVPFLPILLVTAACSGSSSDSCVTLTGNGDLAGVGSGPAQVMIETKFVLIDRDSFADLGLDFTLTTPIQSDTAGAPGGVSHQGSDVVADAGTVGGPSGVPYLVPNSHDGFLSATNLNFVSPFTGQTVKIFTALPFPGQCVTIDSAVATAIQNFAGGADQALLSPADPGIDGNALYETPDPTALANLLSQIEGDTRNKILDAPGVTTFDGQHALMILQDVNPQVGDLTPAFQSAVQSVITTPFNIYSGVTLDIRPVISADQLSVDLEIRFSTGLSFERSIPADVGGQPADIEIPVVAPGTVKTTVTVPDGQTVVVGDLRREGQTATEQGVPVLGNLPVVGMLFRNQSNENQNLIILVTPTIIAGQEE